ncbi:uncharacterized protein LOC111357662 [Spodoptera litura]|uniref:Takeout n=1 Tax=Spodoptera litura TaxID=69820 RepID=A0A3G1KKW6_SPOLT|nr:uncharacterized protein LOC111357662 [Spodoptera litura]ATU07278.1 takeout [Spodoptera litura]
MYSKYLFVALLLSVAYTADAAYAPFIEKCKWDDSKCIKATAQNAIPILAAGIPELGVETLDPFSMKTLDASSPTLKLLLWNITGTGLKDCIAKKVQRDIGKSKITVKLQCSVDFVGKYEMKGRMLMLPIEGKGDAHVVLRKVVITTDVDIGDNLGRDGEKHWSIKNWKHTYDVKEKSTIELENLFNGNQVLGNAARAMIESSSNEIVKEIGPPIVKAIISRIVDNIQAFFENVPSSEFTD